MSSEAVYMSSRAVVRFAIYPSGFKGARVLAEISTRALREVFGAQGDGDSLIAAYRGHFAKIQIKALTLHCREPGAPILLDTADFDQPGQPGGVAVAIDERRSGRGSPHPAATGRPA